MRGRARRTAIGCAATALAGTPLGYIGSSSTSGADATTYLGSILFNTSAISWFVVPTISILALRRPAALLLLDLLRSGSWTDRCLEQLRSSVRNGALIVLTSTAVWWTTAVLAASSAIHPVTPFMLQALLLSLTLALLFCSIRAVSDLHGRSWGVGAALALWVWMIASEQGIISPSPPWSAAALIDARIGVSSPAAAVATTCLLLSVTASVVGSALLRDRAQRGEGGILFGSGRYGPVIVLLALVALSTSLSDPRDRPLWQVLVPVLGNPAHTPTGTIIALLVSFVLPWQGLTRSGDERRLLPERLVRHGSVARLFVSRVLRSIGPAAALLVVVPATVVVVVVTAGGADLSPPPRGWFALIACYAFIGLSAIVTCVAVLQLAVLVLRQRGSVPMALTVLGVIASATTSLPPGPPRLAVDLTLSLDGDGWIPTAASSAGTAFAVVLLGVLFLRRHQRSLEF